MIRSMTGFARYTPPSKGKNWVIEIRSVNQRYFDLNLRIPSSLFSFESKIRNLVQSALRRGKITLSILEIDLRDTKSLFSVNDIQVKSYLKSAKEIKNKFRISGDLMISDVMKFPGVIKEKPNGEQNKISWKETEGFLSRALAKTNEYKREEGKKIEKDIRMRLVSMKKVLILVESLAKKKEHVAFKKISERIDKILEKKEIDEDRVYREAAFLVEKSDITEEIVRMRSHLSLFDNFLKKTGEIGRELDFLCQEMNREINTIASKAQMFEVSKEVIAMKSELEKIREQVQNVE